MLRSKFFWIAAVLAAGMFALAVLPNASIVYATEQTKSRFIVGFDPSGTIRQFVDVPSTQRGQGSSAGSRAPWDRRNIRHTADFGWMFRPKPAAYPALMAAVENQVTVALSASRASITHEEVEHGRFTFTYRCGRTTGTVRVEAPVPVEGSNPAFDKLAVHIEESWAVGK